MKRFIGFVFTAVLLIACSGCWWHHERDERGGYEHEHGGDEHGRGGYDHDRGYGNH